MKYEKWKIRKMEKRKRVKKIYKDRNIDIETSPRYKSSIFLNKTNIIDSATQTIHTRGEGNCKFEESP
jgi:hypothetical protein